MYIKKLFILTILFCIPFCLSAGVYIPEKDAKIFEKNIATIVSLGRMVQGQKNTLIIEKLFQKRQAFMRDTLHLYTSFGLRALRKPTLDVSTRYRLTLQKYKLSCEIAALRMIIEAVTRKPISEDTIIASLPVFPGKLSSDGIWGDPEKEFVGSYHGAQRLVTGYGIYEAPLALFLQDSGIASEVSNSMTSGDILPRDRMKSALESLSAGSHIILWGDWCTTPVDEDGLVEKVDNYILRFLPLPGRNKCDRPAEERTISWTTPLGKSITGLSGEHAFLLLGYLGPIEKPSHIIVWDTDTGKHIYRTSEWMRKWGLLDYRMLIVSGEDISGI